MYTCDICNKQYTNKQNLTRHIKTHEGRSYECQYCRKTFFYQSSMKRHELVCNVPPNKKITLKMFPKNKQEIVSRKNLVETINEMAKMIKEIKENPYSVTNVEKVKLNVHCYFNTQDIDSFEMCRKIV